MADRYYVNALADKDGNAAGNWSTESGGAGGAGFSAADVLIFDLIGNGNFDCDFSAAVACAGITVEATYVSHLDINDHDATIGGPVTLDGGVGGSFKCGTGTITVTLSEGEAFDNKDQNGWDAESSHLRLVGTGSLASTQTRTFYDLTFAADSTITLTTYAKATNAIAIDGTASVNANQRLISGSNCETTVGGGGRLTGNGLLLLESPGAGKGITSVAAGAVIDIAMIWWPPGHADAVLAPARYDCGNRLSIYVGASDGTVRLSAGGEYIFGGELRLTTSGEGSLTMDNAANGPASITVEGDLRLVLSSTGDLTIDDSGQAVDWDLQGDVIDEITGGGTFTWTEGDGDYCLSGLVDQQIDCGSRAWPQFAITKPTSGNVELVEVDLTLGDVDMAESLTITSGDVDTATAATVAIEGDVTADNNALDFGDGTTWTIGGSLDYEDVTTVTKGTSTIVLTGTGNLTPAPSSSRALNNLTINGTTTIAGSHIGTVTGTLAVNGTLAIPTGKTFYMTSPGTLELGAGGALSGDGTFIGYGLGMDAGITAFPSTATIDVANLHIRPGTASTGFPAGNYQSRLKLYNSMAYAALLTLDSGDYTLKSLEIENTDAGGSMTLDNASHDPNITIATDVTWTQTLGTCTWTKGDGVITASSGENQSWDFGGSTVEDIVVAKSAGTLTLTGGVTTDSLTVSSGTLSFGGQTVGVSGDLWIGGDAQTVSAGCNGSTITVGGDCTLIGRPGDLLGLAGGAAWNLDVTGKLTAINVNLKNCTAGVSGGVAYNSTNGGGNVNWTFVDTPLPNSLRSGLTLGI